MEEMNWDEVGAEEIPTTEFDKAIDKMLKLWDVVEEKKEAATLAREEYDKAEGVVMDLLKRTKKTKYYMEGVGTTSVVHKYTIKTPKSTTDKSLLFEWIRGTQGPENLLGLLSINSQTLNAFVNSEKEKNPMVEIPGLEPPVLTEQLRFTKQRK
jgi:hypothetical protein